MKKRISTSRSSRAVPISAPPQVIAGGGADVVLDWLPSALASREKGLPLVNIAQPFKTLGHDAHLSERHRDQVRPRIFKR